MIATGGDVWVLELFCKLFTFLADFSQIGVNQ